jgi:hypothetical protein
MCLDPVTYEHLNVPGPCDLTVHCISTPQKCQVPPRHKIPTHRPHKSTDPE